MSYNVVLTAGEAVAVNDEKNFKPPLLALVGPTAVGKSELALQIASRLQTEIICADSAQVYRYLDIGTAKPTAREQALVPHHLIDLVDPDQGFSVAAYQKAALTAIEAVRRRGRLPLLVGGTGLYVRAIADAYAFGAEGKDEALRNRLNREAADGGLERLYRRLREIDPGAAAKIHPNDQRRIIRALEYFTLEGKPISGQVEQTVSREQPFNLLIFGLTMPRDALYRRIDCRVDKMLALDFLGEVKKILQMGYRSDCPGLQILGYRQLAGFVQGREQWEETVQEIKTQTRRLAKRQFTWFRRDPRIIWLEVMDEAGYGEPAEIIYHQVKEKLPLQANSII
jgi:tRNA dimethylallyltransferase